MSPVGPVKMLKSKQVRLNEARARNKLSPWLQPKMGITRNERKSVFWRPLSFGALKRVKKVFIVFFICISFFCFGINETITFAIIFYFIFVIHLHADDTCVAVCTYAATSVGTLIWLHSVNVWKWMKHFGGGYVTRLVHRLFASQPRPPTNAPSISSIYINDQSTFTHTHTATQNGRLEFTPFRIFFVFKHMQITLECNVTFSLHLMRGQGAMM